MFKPWRTLRGVVVMAITVCGLATLGPAASAGAAGQRGSAFVWNYDPSPPIATWYTPTGEYQYNSTSPGEPDNRIMRTDTGIYVVDIPGLVGFGATHATAYGWDAAYCNAGDTVASTFSRVEVRCFAANGTRVDHAFTLSFTNVDEPWPGQQMAYMEVESNGTVWASRDYNSAGYPTTVTRQGSGYLVRLPGLGSSFGHVQVTAADDGNRCKVVGWYPSGFDELILVQCWNKGWFGAPEDAPFILTYVNQQNILGLPAGVPPDGHESAYAWADQPSADVYTPHAYYQYSSSGDEPTAAHGYGTGTYMMTFNGVDMFNGNVQVTAYGSGQEFCAVNYWLGSDVQVQCYNWDGTPADTYYTVAFTGL